MDEPRGGTTNTKSNLLSFRTFVPLCHLKKAPRQSSFVDRFLTSGHINIGAGHRTRVVAGREHEWDSAASKHVRNRVHMFFAQIDIEHGTIQALTIPLKNDKSLRNRSSRPGYFSAERFKRSGKIGRDDVLVLYDEEAAAL